MLRAYPLGFWIVAGIAILAYLEAAKVSAALQGAGFPVPSSGVLKA